MLESVVKDDNFGVGQLLHNALYALHSFLAHKYRGFGELEFHLLGLVTHLLVRRAGCNLEKTFGTTAIASG